MGYDLHITRKVDWSDDDGEAISLDEWTAYVDSDPSMRLDGYAEAATPSGEVLRTESPGLAVWVSYSGHGVDGNMAWFGHSDRSGAVVVKNADQEIRRKMHEIATALRAKVQGDDGEEYGPTGAELAVESNHRAADPPWWRFWR